jgi:hypothetical protein
MENLIAAIRELQVGQQMIVADIKATRVDQKEMAAIRAGQKEMRAAISHLRSVQADLEITFNLRVNRILIAMDRSIRSLCEEVNRHETFIKCLGNKDLTNTLSKATQRGLETKLAEVEDQVCPENSSNARIFVETGSQPKGSLLPGTERLVCLPSGGTPQKDFPEQGQRKPEKREYTNKKGLVTCPLPHYTTTVYKGIRTNLQAIGRIGDKPCIVTVDTGASVSIARPDIVAGLPERDVPKKACVRSISGQTLPILKEALVKLTLGKRLLITWVFVASITEEFMLGLDVMYAHDAVVDLRRHVLRLGGEEVLLRCPFVQPT